ncbi:threonine aldolase family protein [Thalassococcus lentus]|uniref:Beta-eliminating lyase-related protein n=1 Tax=Thalassococcus lentus TaxID=1210524 RepID=A0ABT4XT73_9RHOB|nr:beta-eliminating lyase-related protein [Thalassococcus lentus]MDA7425154.1 beta-eliminating lyase-related protein [Thalassococcus lentus]
MNFASDNGGPAPQAVLDALAAANSGYAGGYGGDDLSQDVADRIRTLFEAPDAAVYLAATGTSANALALATLVQPFETVFCTPDAHIHMDECNAPEFFTSGAKLTLVPGDDRMTAAALRGALNGEENRGVHGPQRGAVSLTNVTEAGNVYTLSELKALCAVAKEFDLPVHLDGARFANACATLGCTPADMTWKAGVDVAVFGGTKNGLLGVEAVILFDQSRAWEFELRRKRGGHLFSKHRFLAAQMSAYLDNDNWMTWANAANSAGMRLRQGLEALGIGIANETQANMVFFNAPRRVHRALLQAGAIYHPWGDLDGGAEDAPITGRLVCDWSTQDSAIDGFLALCASALKA